MKKNPQPLTSSFTQPTSGNSTKEEESWRRFSLVSLAYIFALKSLPDSTLWICSSNQSPTSSAFSEQVGVQGRLWTMQCRRFQTLGDPCPTPCPPLPHWLFGLELATMKVQRVPLTSNSAVCSISIYSWNLCFTVLPLAVMPSTAEKLLISRNITSGYHSS
jgi:hypothetical protein